MGGLTRFQNHHRQKKQKKKTKNHLGSMVLALRKTLFMFQSLLLLLYHLAPCKPLLSLMLSPTKTITQISRIFPATSDASQPSIPPDQSSTFSLDSVLSCSLSSATSSSGYTQRNPSPWIMK